VVIGLAVVVAVAPLGSDHFAVAVPVVAGLAVVYAAVGLARFDGAAEGWGFVPPPRSDLEVVRGCLGAGVLVLAAFGPILVVHAFIERPWLGDPWSYLLWCAVQDFLFFSLFLRNAAGLVTPHPAVLLTAVLFGLSHAPLEDFMYVTGLIAVPWGYVFLYSRLLWVVTASHFLLGVLVLA
jgi:hypothetical protein